MNVKFQGFELSVCKAGGITKDDYIEYLSSISGTEIRYSPFNRILGINLTGNKNYILGLFVSIKNQRRFTEIHSNRGQFELVAKDLATGSRLADFNFFILNKNTLRGIYQYYHQSCSLQQFLGFLSSRFYDLKKREIEKIKESPEYPDGTLDARLKKVQKSLLNTQVMVRSETFHQLIDQLDEIKEMKFTIATYEADEGWFTPLRECAKKRTERILFNKDMLSSIRSGIREVTSKNDLSDVQIKGKFRESGIEATIKLFDNVDDFGQYDYDKLTEHLAVDIDSFCESEIIKLLLHTAEENNQVF